MTGRPVPVAARELISALNRYSRYESPNKPVESRASDRITEAERSKPKPPAK